MFQIKTTDQKLENKDGFRILINKTWPEELSKENARFDLWLKDITPSNELEECYKKTHCTWDEFKNKYQSELKGKNELIKQLKIIEKFNKTVTIIHSYNDKEHNPSVILLKYLQKPVKQVITTVARIHGG
jgi:uncharacterized protein YeaO (DUF488 family)